jgi:hypothetical protein
MVGAKDARTYRQGKHLILEEKLPLTFEVVWRGFALEILDLFSY